MLPYTPPLWLTVAFVIGTITLNLTAFISRKGLNKHLDGMQEDGSYTKDVTYWTYAISSSIANIINIIVVTLIAYLLLCGLGWVKNQHPYVFLAIVCVLIWLVSLGCMWALFITKRPQKNAQEYGTLVDPNDRDAINCAIAWISFNVALDIVLWLAAPIV